MSVFICSLCGKELNFTEELIQIVIEPCSCVYVEQVKDIPEEYLQFHKEYPGSKSKTKDFQNFVNKNKKDWKSIIPKLLPALRKEIVHKEILKEIGEFCPQWKNLQRWINNRCWEQELPELTKKKTSEQIRKEKINDLLREAENIQEPDFPF